jgi:hypothetical protein
MFLARFVVYFLVKVAVCSVCNFKEEMNVTLFIKTSIFLTEYAIS